MTRTQRWLLDRWLDPPDDPTGPKADRDRREAAQAQTRRDDAALRKPDREP